MTALKIKVRQVALSLQDQSETGMRIIYTSVTTVLTSFVELVPSSSIFSSSTLSHFDLEPGVFIQGDAL
jgi:hypothetical protein